MIEWVIYTNGKNKEGTIEMYNLIIILIEVERNVVCW